MSRSPRESLPRRGSPRLRRPFETSCRHCDPRAAGRRASYRGWGGESPRTGRRHMLRPTRHCAAPRAFECGRRPRRTRGCTPWGSLPDRARDHRSSHRRARRRHTRRSATLRPLRWKGRTGAGELHGRHRAAHGRRGAGRSVAGVSARDVDCHIVGARSAVVAFVGFAHAAPGVRTHDHKVLPRSQLRGDGDAGGAQ